jgi:cytochrome c oxidase subunit 2
MKKMMFRWSGAKLILWASLLLTSTLAPLSVFAQADPASDVIPAPKEFSLSTADLVYYAYWVLALLVLLVIVYIFNIGAASEKLTGRTVINWTKVNAWMSIIFLVAGSAGVAYELVYHGKHLLPEAASAHGDSIDNMFNWTFGFTFAVFVITEVLLFWFLFKYRQKEGRKAAYFFHNNQLEVIWTIVPAIVLTFLVLRGYSTWHNITQKPEPKAKQIEVFGYQFGWKARYAGEDNKFGEANFNFIDPATNELGLAIKPTVIALRDTLMADTGRLGNDLRNLSSMLKVKAEQLSKMSLAADGKAYTDLEQELEDIRNGSKASELRKMIKRKGVQIQRINATLDSKDIFNESANDDKITTEIHLVKDQPYTFRYRARDVIHSAYMPYFRAQMNVVPGMMTSFTFTPTKTTKQMQEELKNPEFQFYLFCAKICGSAHYNMKIKIVVESEAEYNAWIEKQKRVVEPLQPESPTAPAEAKDTTANPKTATNRNIKPSLAMGF